MSEPGNLRRSRRPETLTIYAIGLFQGLALVAVPAAASILTDPSGYGLSSSQYGVLFVPQVVLAIAGALGVRRLAEVIGLKSVLLVGVGADVVAMSVLAASNAVAGNGAAYPLLLVATGFLGLGFGVTLSAISTYAGALNPDRREVALTTLNVMLGLGTALSPILVAVFLDHGQWWYLPLLTAAGLLALAIAAGLQPLDAVLPRAAGSAATGRVAIPRLFWLFAAALVAYGICETMFGNWGTTLLHDQGVSAAAADYSLAMFWAAVTVGRILIAVGSRQVRTTEVYVGLPIGIAITLFVVAAVHSAAGGIVLFGLGGLACSGFFPMTVGYGESTFPELTELAAGGLIAAYQVGYGLAAFGTGLLVRALSLPSVFRIAGVVAVAMALLAVPIVRRQARATDAGREAAPDA
jgi:MFS transporter, FHS family, glucose/mannose:H+ symporter